MKRRSSVFFIFVIVVLFLGMQLAGSSKQAAQEKEQAAGSEKGELTLADCDELMKEKTVENSKKAVKGYELLLKKDPKNYELLCKIAKAYIAIVDTETSAMIEEKDEYKPVLEKYGQLANDYAHKAYEINPKDKDVVSACLVAYGYYSSSFGIFKAIFKGAAGHFKDLANELNAIDETHLGALGHRSLGKLYYMAPWPVGSNKKALKSFQKAAQIDKTTLGARYYIGLLNFDKDKYDLAKKAFTFVVDNPPAYHEKHYIEEYKKESQKYLKKIEKKLKK